MTLISPSIYNAFNICPRQAWLMSRQLTADQQNEFLIVGRLIDETTFAREKKKIYIPEFNAMIDLIIKEGKVVFIGEIKKSSRTLKTGIEQLKYYLYILKQKGIDAHGVIKIPKEKKSVKVELTLEDETTIKEKLQNLNKLLQQESPPKPKKIRFCSKCAHFEFCWS